MLSFVVSGFGNLVHNARATSESPASAENVTFPSSKPSTSSTFLARQQQRTCSIAPTSPRIAWVVERINILIVVHFIALTYGRFRLLISKMANPSELILFGQRWMG